MSEIYKLSNFNRKRNKVKKRQKDDPQLQFGLEEDDDDDDDDVGGCESSEVDSRLDSVYRLLDQHADEPGHHDHDDVTTEESGSGGSGFGEEYSAAHFMKEIGWITGLMGRGLPAHAPHI
jgi:hypothetical protein